MMAKTPQRATGLGCQVPSSNEIWTASTKLTLGRDDRNREQHLMPLLRDIVFVFQRDESLDEPVGHERETS